MTTSFAFSNNRISGQNYNADGNLLDDPVIPATGVNAYDAEGHAVKFENATVVYDALGRAAEVNGTWQFVYGPAGRKLAVMNGATLARADIPLPGGDEAVYNASGLAYFRRGDWLGSTRLSSTPAGTVYASRAYTPYGAPYDESGGSGDRDFTGAKQDIAPNKYDFLHREYEPVSGRWFTPDPAGLAAVDPNNPQSWNRYAYVGGNPLGAVDPLGLHCIPVAKLNNGSKDKQVAGEFGPYSPDEDGTQQAGDDGYSGCANSGGGPDVWLDGVDLGSGGLAGDFVGGGEPIGGVAVCAWADCMGAGSIFDQNNNLRQFQTKWTEQSEPCTPSASAAFCVTVVDHAVTTQIDSNTNCSLGAVLCSILPNFTFAGIVPGEPMPSADGLQAVVTGFANAVHPIEVAAANAAMFATGAALAGFGYSIAAAGCADPTPFEPLTCAGGLLAGGFIGTIGAGDLALGAAFFKTVTLPAFENWGGGE